MEVNTVIRYLKAGPTSYVMQFKNGRVKRQGAGLSFFYWEPTSTLVQVPLASADVPFCFTETTADFQTVTVQGQLTWRVAEPAKLASLLDYSVSPAGEPLSDDPQKLEERLVHTAQILTRASTGSWSLKQSLTGGEALCASVLEGLRSSEAVKMLGVEVLALAVLSVRATPEMARALEAEARESLQRQSDSAIYERRNAAVEQERRIKESELQTDVMVEQQRRHIREKKMEADVAMEQARQKLVEQKAENDKKAADAQGYALAATLAPVRTLDWKVLTSLSAASMDPAAMIALGFRELAENAAKIGELNISPDLLRALLPATPAPKKGG